MVTPTASDPPPPSAACPRCGYDVGSIIARWTDECPLDGRCWECELDFAWADLLRPERRADPTMFEHAPPGTRVHAAWRTASRALRSPKAFWSRVRLEHVVIPRRLARWVILMFALPWLLGVLKSLTVLLLSPALTYKTALHAEVILDTVRQMAAPIAGVSLTWAPPGVSASGYALTPGPPWDDGAWGFVYSGLLAQSLLYPIMVLVLPDTRSKSRVRGAHIARAFAISLVWVPVAFLANVPGEAVRWMATRSVSWSSFAYTSPLGGSIAVGDWSQLIALIIMTCWMARWWWCVLRDGWRLPQPRRVALAAIVAATLAGLIMFLVDHHSRNLVTRFF